MQAEPRISDVKSLLSEVFAHLISTTVSEFETQEYS